MRTKTNHSRHVFEPLENRTLLSTYYVSNAGSDAAAGSSTAPWATLQQAANHVKAGDTVNVAAGKYAGMVLGWDTPVNGTASAPITFKAQPGATITSRNNKTPDGIDLEGASYITIDGFTINNADGSITRAGIRSVQNQGAVITNNKADHNGTWGIFTSHSENVRIENNVTSRSINQHGIYVSNSADNPIIRGNVSFGNTRAGIHVNGDASQGGDGIISNASIENNVLYDNGYTAASAINCDGVQNSVIRNNLLYNNHAAGISLFDMDGAAGSKNNVVVNNTIVMASDGRWAINIKNGSTGNTLLNNILLNNGSNGAINIASDSLSGLHSNYNVVKDRFSPDDGGSTESLADWRSQTGQDKNSIIASPSQVFANAGANDYRLSSSSPAINAGTSTNAPATDILGHSRVGAVDIGAYEYGGTATTPPTTPTNPPSTPTSTPTWDNHAIASQSGNFTFEFDAKPTQSNADVIVGLSAAAASQYSDLAAIVRFNSSGQIDARNGDTYTAATALNYAAATSYHVKMVVRTAQHQYDVYVTPQGKSQVLLGQNYAFRSEQAGVTALANWAKFNYAGDAAVSNVMVGSQTVPTGSGNGLTAQYFDNADFTNLKVTRVDPTVDFSWAYGSPDASIAPDTFSARWTGKIQPKFSETYTFSTTSDDGVRLWVNGQEIVNNWTNHGATVNSGTIALQAGQKYDIKMEYYENTGNAVAKLAWASASQPLQIVPTGQLFSV